MNYRAGAGGDNPSVDLVPGIDGATKAVVLIGPANRAGEVVWPITDHPS
jgi:hypothetical protein